MRNKAVQSCDEMGGGVAAAGDEYDTPIIDLRYELGQGRRVQACIRDVGHVPTRRVIDAGPASRGQIGENLLERASLL